MWRRAARFPDRPAMRWMAGVVLAAFLFAGEGTPVRGQSKPARAFPRSCRLPTTPSGPQSLPGKTTRTTGQARKSSSARRRSARTAHQFRAKMVLEAGRGAPVGTRFRWQQIDGPTVPIDDPRKPSIEITIPAGSAGLAFLLVASHPDAVRVVRVIVPLPGRRRGPHGGRERRIGSRPTPATIRWGWSPPGHPQRFEEPARRRQVRPLAPDRRASRRRSPAPGRILLVHPGQPGTLPIPPHRRRPGRTLRAGRGLGADRIAPRDSRGDPQPAPAAVQPAAAPAVPNPEQVVAAALPRMRTGLGLRLTWRM